MNSKKYSNGELFCKMLGVERENCDYDDRSVRCAWCGENIFDKYYQIDGDSVCAECIEQCERII